MKSLKIQTIVYAVLVLLISSLFAQVSDYDIIQNFKKSYQAIYDSVRTASSLEKCDLLEQKISSLKTEYSKHQALLNDGLHPDNFDGSFTKLNSQLSIAKEKNKLAVDLGSSNLQNDSLRQEVSSLNSRIQQLADENGGFLQEIKSLKLTIKKDKETIARMSKLIDKLKANIEARDNLVINMLDSLFIEFSKPDLNDVEKGNLQLTVNSKDFLRTILNTVNDNEKFIESASLTAQDVMFIKEEHKKFSGLWKKVSPSIGQLYPDEATKAQSIGMVDNKISSWKNKIEATIWKSIYLEFTKQNISVQQFKNATEFHDNLLTYIDLEMQQPSKEKFIAFNDSVWEPVIKDQWMAVIQSDNSLTEPQRIEIEDKIDLWGKNFSSGMWIWFVLGGLGIVFLLIIIALVIKLKKKTTENNNVL